MMAWLTSAQVLRWGIFIAYSIALFIGVALIFSRQPGLPLTFTTERPLPANSLLQPGDLTFTAERELPANSLLQPGDLALRPGDHPWYLKHTAKKDQKIGLGDLSTFPIIAARPGKLPVAFSVGSAMVKSSAINAGISVRVCQGAKVLAESVEVQAVLCPATDEPCVALADVPADKASALTGVSQAATPATLQIMSSQCQ